MDDLTPQTAPAVASWKERAIEHWSHIRDTGRLLGPSARFLTTTEAHTYAYSVAANILLAFLPFILMLVWLAQLAPGLPGINVINQAIQIYLPAGQSVIIRDVARSAHHHGSQVFSIFMLAVSSSGVFLPLEVALNGIWGFKKNRSYIGNQLTSLALVASCGAIAFLSVELASLSREIIFSIVPTGWTWLPELLSFMALKLFAFPAAIFSFFIIYWRLPNGKVPAAQVFPAAFYTGILAEIFKSVFRWILPLLDFRSVYASLTLAVTLVMWGFGGALLLLFGASLSARGVLRMPNARSLYTRAWHRHHHEEAVPHEDAVPPAVEESPVSPQTM